MKKKKKKENQIRRGVGEERVTKTSFLSYISPAIMFLLLFNYNELSVLSERK